MATLSAQEIHGLANVMGTNGANLVSQAVTDAGTAGVVNSSAGTLQLGTNTTDAVTVVGRLRLQVQDALTAHAGGGQASALAITGNIARFTTVATAGDSGKLPASAAGLEVTVINDAALPMQMFGAGTDTINGVATATGVVHPPYTALTYNCTVAGKWEVTAPRYSQANSAITTAGAGTLTAASVVRGVITRTGPVAAYTDTFDTAALILAAAPAVQIGQSWLLVIKNTVPFNQTVATAAGITLTGQAIVPPNSVGAFLVSVTALTTVSIQGLGSLGMTALPLEANTAITTIGAGTLTAAAIACRLITRSGSVAAYTDTVDTAVAIIAALPNANVGDAFEFTIKNTVGFAETIATAAGVTLAGQTIIPPNSVGRFLVKIDTATTCTITGIQMSPMTTPPLETNTAITTAGAGVLTAAGIVGQLVTRTGPSAAYTDTTDTAANIIATMPNANVGDSFEFAVKNCVAFISTLAADTGVTLAGLTKIPPLSVGKFLCVVTAATTVTITGISTSPLCVLPASKFTTSAAASPLTAAAGDLTGAAHTFFQVTTNGAFGLTTRTAAEMFGDIANAQIGTSFLLTVVSQGDNTVTITGGSNVTITGTATVATKTTRTYVCTFTTASALTMQSVSKGTIE